MGEKQFTKRNATDDAFVIYMYKPKWLIYELEWQQLKYAFNWFMAIGNDK